MIIHTSIRTDKARYLLEFSRAMNSSAMGRHICKGSII